MPHLSGRITLSFNFFCTVPAALGELKNLPSGEAAIGLGRTNAARFLMKQREKMDRLLEGVWKGTGPILPRQNFRRISLSLRRAHIGIKSIQRHVLIDSHWKRIAKDFSKRSRIEHRRGSFGTQWCRCNRFLPKGDAKAHDGSEAKHCDGGEAEQL
nr:hypothetical protein Iba_chr04fCG12370 [Ipomoea batatas]